MEFAKLGASTIAGLLASGQASATEILKAHFAAVERLEPSIDAFLYTAREEGLLAAQIIDEKIAKNVPVGPLAGVPVGLKDNLCTKGMPTTCASRMLQHFVPPYSATVAEKLHAAGAVITGKLNLDEFAMGSSCENSYFKPTKNPWNIAYVPGGSSGGSAAAVAAGMLPLALGSDTGGSIRQPAAFCGVVGMKPSYGVVSRYGLVAFASSMDQIGPLARNVQDAALGLRAIAGRDARDATSAACPMKGALDTNIEGLRIGLPKEYFGPDIAPEVRAAVEKAVALMEGQGARAEEMRLPATQYAYRAYYILSSAEASSNLARFDGVKYGYRAKGAGTLEELYTATRSEGFGAEVQRRILMGALLLSGAYKESYYERAMHVRRMVAQEFSRAFTKYDVLMMPTVARTAFALGSTQAPQEEYATDALTAAANLAGVPAISLPCGCDAAGLPMGVQMIAPRFCDWRLLGMAKAYEDAAGGFPQAEVCP